MIAFNTGRAYTNQGQRIAAMITADGGLLFVDIDRGIDGFIRPHVVAEHELDLTERTVLHAYDYWDQEWSSNHEPFKRPEDMERLRAAAVAVPGGLR